MHIPKHLQLTSPWRPWRPWPPGGCVYFPTAWNADGAAKQMYDVLNLLVDACIQEGDIPIAGGDFNAKKNNACIGLLEPDAFTMFAAPWTDFHRTKECKRHNVGTLNVRKFHKEARMKLEERITKLEEGKGAQKSNLTLEDADVVEKDRVVVGGFTDLDGEEAEKLVNEVLATCPGFEGAFATNPTPTVVMAKFNTPGMAMRMIKNQKFNPKMKENKLWASENRSPTERRQCKLVSKLKKLLIEQDKHDPKNVIVSYKWFHVRVRNGRTFTNVATVNEDGEVLWAEDIGQVSATVKECMAEIEANME